MLQRCSLSPQCLFFHWTSQSNSVRWWSLTNQEVRDSYNLEVHSAWQMSERISHYIMSRLSSGQNDRFRTQVEILSCPDRRRRYILGEGHSWLVGLWYPEHRATLAHQPTPRRNLCCSFAACHFFQLSSLGYHDVKIGFPKEKQRFFANEGCYSCCVLRTLISPFLLTILNI